MTFDYNTTRKKLILAEYGRNVQNMVKYIVDLPTKEERNRYAQVVIDLMGFLNPHLRDVADFKHKLWDHLHIISNFKIDVDSPYPKPSEDAIRFKPSPMPYPQHRIRYKHYGKTVELMIGKAKSIDDSERKQLMVQSIANFMKMAYVTWNKDSVADETIIKDLLEMSNGDLQLEEHVNLQRIDARQIAPVNRQRNSNQKNRQSSNRNNGSNRQRSNNQGGKRY
jgi:hypothetical protein